LYATIAVVDLDDADLDVDLDPFVFDDFVDLTPLVTVDLLVDLDPLEAVNYKKVLN